ncbi:MAG: hypothetical protein RL095_232 [Verrucomicrobiota bacterium]|jgi:leucyl-tRNA synthetase
MSAGNLESWRAELARLEARERAESARLAIFPMGVGCGSAKHRKSAAKGIERSIDRAKRMIELRRKIRAAERSPTSEAKAKNLKDFLKRATEFLRELPPEERKQGRAQIRELRRLASIWQDATPVFRELLSLLKAHGFTAGGAT